jgi:predicted nucleic acid-binding protein
VLDIQIAACVWTHGHEVATENCADFEALSRLIARLIPIRRLRWLLRR